VADLVGRAKDGEAVGGELLPQANGHGVHHVGAAGFQDIVELFPFLGQFRGQQPHLGHQFVQQENGRQPHGGGEDVVGGLPEVDVVVGVDDRVVAAFAAQDFNGAVADDLVGVHVEADTGAGLVDINHELVVKLAGDDFVGGLGNGPGPLLID
jgi:hypothetical protein